MVRNLSLNTLFVVTIFVINIIGNNHWGYLLAKIICFIFWVINFNIALKKEKELIERIEKLEKTHKEKE